LKNTINGSMLREYCNLKKMGWQGDGRLRQAWRSGMKAMLALGLVFSAMTVIGTSASAAGDFNRSIEGPPGGYGSLSWEYQGLSRTTYYTIYRYLDTSEKYWKKVYYDKNNNYVKTTYGVE
jgi:hypothetical protein